MSNNNRVPKVLSTNQDMFNYILPLLVDKYAILMLKS